MLELEIINHRCKYHDCEGSCNMATSYYEDIKKDICRIRAYRKFKKRYSINGKKYDYQMIQDILKIYDGMGYLINIIETTMPHIDDRYRIDDVNNVVSTIMKLLLYMKGIDFIFVHNVLNDLSSSHTIEYNTIKILNRYLHGIVKTL